MHTPSVGTVHDTCQSACKTMKLQSKQLMTLSASYSKRPFEKSGDAILETLTITMESLHKLQDSLLKTAKIMKMELESDHIVDVDTVTVTKKEYVLLNAVFDEYTNVITSNEFSLFSNQHNIQSGLLECRDNEEKSSAS